MYLILEGKDMLTNSQQKALELVRSGANVFLTGKAGTGKSYLTDCIIEELKSAGKKMMICAPTGIAALNINGVTLHSAFRAKGSIQEPGDFFCPQEKNKQKKVIDEAEVIIIDEISMCRTDLFEYVTNSCLMSKKEKQYILVGDFFQLPPILMKEETKAYMQLYKKKIFAFQSEMWRELNFITIELQEVVRQKDPKLIEALDHIREGKPDFAVFEKVRNLKEDKQAIRLCTTNSKVKQINDSNLKKLEQKYSKKKSAQSDIRTYLAVVSGAFEAPPTEKELTLIKDARVMILANKKGAYVNGSLGYIKELGDDEIVVKLDSGDSVSIEKYSWEKYEYNVVEKDGKKKLEQVVVASFQQFPLKLAWAITVHKSQGQTFDKVIIYAENFFSPGQMYVALSRCRTLKGMNIIGKLENEDVAADPEVLEFMKGNSVTKSTSKLQDKLDVPETKNEIQQNISETKSKEVKSGRGGHRSGAGRKSKWGIPTKILRIPECLEDEILTFIEGKMKSI